MMKRYLHPLYLLFVVCYLPCYAQQTIKVIDGQTNRPVPYATVSFLLKNVAYATDKEGLLQVPEDLALKQGDSLYISRMGYQVKKTVFITSDGKIALNLQKALAESKKSQIAAKDILNEVEPDSIDRFAGMETGIDSANYLQLAQKFYLKQAGALLNEVTLYQHILVEDYPEAIPAYERPKKLGRKLHFRLRFYDVDSVTGKPGNELNDRLVEVAGSFEKTIRVDLGQYKIFVPGKYFFVAIEWIRNRANGVLLEAEKQTKPSNIGYGVEYFLKYMPSVAMSPRLSIAQNTWKLNLRNQWQPYTYFAPEFTDLAIMVKLNYLK